SGASHGRSMKCRSMNCPETIVSAISISSATNHPSRRSTHPTTAARISIIQGSSFRRAAWGWRRHHQSREAGAAFSVLHRLDLIDQACGPLLALVGLVRVLKGFSEGFEVGLRIGHPGFLE